MDLKIKSSNNQRFFVSQKSSVSKTIKIALAGNPNVGKSTLFNTLTGTRQHVGNWPGKTIEKKHGCLKYKNKSIDIVDLPGTYSLTAYSEEEIITRNFIIEEKPDVIIHIVDAANIERNLYLAVQLIELRANLILALNFTAYAEKKGIKIHEKKISRLLGVPVVKIEANSKKDVDELLGLAVAASKKCTEPKKIRYGKEIQHHVSEIENLIINQIKLPSHLDSKWMAIKLLEHDDEVIGVLKSFKNSCQVLEEIAKVRRHLEAIYREDIDTIFAEARYAHIEGLVRESVTTDLQKNISLSDKIDSIVTHQIIGVPFFFLIMWLIFQVSFTLSQPLTWLIDHFFVFLRDKIILYLTSVSAPNWTISFIGDAVIGGVGSVLLFIPNIFMLFLAIALLEDTGYLARVAFIMDRLMHKIGLHGKSFIPLLLGFGCNVPAIMATRSLDSKKDRLLTILINPFMSCSARLPVYVLFASAFFPKDQGAVIFIIYLIGIAAAIASGLIFNRTLFKGLSSPLVMELPPYRIPTITGLVIHMWERGVSFIQKAGTVIFLLVVSTWLLGNLPFGVDYASQESLIGRAGMFIAPFFKPLGFGTWQASVALIQGFIAKEVIIGTFGAVYGVGSEGLASVLQNVFTPLSAFSFMVFVLLYVPCIATVAVIKKETNSWKWPLFTVLYTTLIAWLASLIVYQGGLLLGFI
ncbi:ferrous iron transport protein B [Candidatus Woesearchaeota archaeon]|nr:ferrous iron transport protein B [Candidatus Woesearchaeota archaeon]